MNNSNELVSNLSFKKKISGLMVGTGEYTTGIVHGQESNSDKRIGVIAPVLIDLKRRQKISKLSMVGTNGAKFPQIRAHFEANIAKKYKEMDISFTSYPEDDKIDAEAYIEAMNKMEKGDFVTICTPDDTHFDLALAAISRGLHVLITKPPVKTIKEHYKLIELAKENNVIVAVEVHKRWDPIYSDAFEQIRNFGDFNYFSSFMSQPKSQLETFRSWAGNSSDISFYLNSHHVDFLSWALLSSFHPSKVIGMGSRGIADEKNIETEDTITLLVQWQSNSNPQKKGMGVYTSSWVAPKSDVHSQQRFHYLGSKGELTVDQAHRGYTLAEDEKGYRSNNPLFMRYTPDSRGYFAAQHCYGYQSIEAFVNCCLSMNNNENISRDEYSSYLAMIDDTILPTAILEAGRMSLDNNNRAVIIHYSDDFLLPVKLSFE